jgi:hypothetical protein
MRRHISLLSLCVLLFTARPAGALENPPSGVDKARSGMSPEQVKKEPSGLGKAQFGMSPQQVEKLYKGQVRTLGQENLGATAIYSPDIVRQVLADQKVGGLSQPTNVELRYWKNKLWVIIVYFGQNSAESVNESLVKQFDKATISSTDYVWQFPKVMVNTANRDRWYAMADTALSREAQAAFAEDMRKAAEQRQTQQAPAAAPPPAPAPAGK